MRKITGSTILIGIILIVGIIIFKPSLFEIVSTEVTFRNEDFSIKSWSGSSFTGYTELRGMQYYQMLPDKELIFLTPGLGATEGILKRDLRKINKITLKGLTTAITPGGWKIKISNQVEQDIIIEGATQDFRTNPLVITRISDTKYQISGYTSKTITMPAKDVPINLVFWVETPTNQGQATIIINDIIVETLVTQSILDPIEQIFTPQDITQSKTTPFLIYGLIGVLALGIGYYIYKKR